MYIAVPQVAAKELYEIANNESEKAVFKVTYMDALKTWLQVPVAMPGAGGGIMPLLNQDINVVP